MLIQTRLLCSQQCRVNETLRVFKNQYTLKGVSTLQQRMVRRFASVVFVILSLLGVSFVTAMPATASAPVLLSGSQWLGGNGVNVCASSTDPYCGAEYRVGGWSGNWWQCVELAQRLYQARGWHSGPFVGVDSAYQIYDRAGNLGMSRQANGSIGSLAPGDMIVHGANEPYSGGAGHVSIVDSVSGTTVKVVEQNTYNNQPRGTYNLSGGQLTRAGSGTIRGIVHDPANQSGTSTAPPPVVTAANKFYLNNNFDGLHDIYTTYGSTNDQALYGDWNGDGVTTLGVRIGNKYYLNNSFDGTHDFTVNYGDPGVLVVSGDWDGNGTETLGVRFGNTYYLDNGFDGVADIVTSYGSASSNVVVGDWDGNGTDTLGVQEGNKFYLNNNFDGLHDVLTTYGDPGDWAFAGDWNGDGVDTLGIRSGNAYYLNNNFDGAHDILTTYGDSNDHSLVGDWNGDGVDTLGIREVNVS